MIDEKKGFFGGFRSKLKLRKCTMKTSRFIRKYLALLCMVLLALTSGRIIDKAHADTSHWYKGPWVIYEDWEHVLILVETNKGVDNDYNHRRLHFYDYGSCKKPSWGYDHVDIDFSGTTKDRRLWTMWAHNLTPGCRYKYNFKFRLTEVSLWSEVSGAFTAGAEDVPDQGYFYALGDQRYITHNNKDPINDVAERVYHNHDNPAFVINTGDMVYEGGYYFPHHDNWWPYFRLKYVRDLFAAMPTFPTPGNHDVGYGHGYANVDAWNYTRYFPYTRITMMPERFITKEHTVSSISFPSLPTQWIRINTAPTPTPITGPKTKAVQASMIGWKRSSRRLRMTRGSGKSSSCMRPCTAQKTATISRMRKPI